MSIQDTVREVRRRTPVPPTRRAGKGVWCEPARVVATLVSSHGWGVSDAVREVVKAHQFHPPEGAFRSIRAAYYYLKSKMV